MLRQASVSVDCLTAVILLLRLPNLINSADVVVSALLDVVVSALVLPLPNLHHSAVVVNGVAGRHQLHWLAAGLQSPAASRHHLPLPAPWTTSLPSSVEDTEVSMAPFNSIFNSTNSIGRSATLAEKFNSTR